MSSYIVKLFHEEWTGVHSFKSAISYCQEFARDADEIEYVIEVETKDHRTTSKVVTTEILDALEKEEIESEREKFNDGQALERSFDSHLEMANTGFFDWRTRSWHGKQFVQQAAE